MFQNIPKTAANNINIILAAKHNPFDKFKLIIEDHFDYLLSNTDLFDYYLQYREIIIELTYVFARNNNIPNNVISWNKYNPPIYIKNIINQYGNNIPLFPWNIIFHPFTIKGNVGHNYLEFKSIEDRDKFIQQWE